MVKKIELTQGKVALIDDEDYDWLSQWKWCARKGKHTYYATRNVYLGIFDGKEKTKTIWMHRLVAGTREGFVTDHVDGDGLNNQRENLRECSNRQNMQNQRKSGTSRFPGIYWNKVAKKWIAQIRVNGKRKFLGYF
ncbi:MAG: HNH endonuclease, partial [Methanobacteriaceae archaeon]|nr:HNH endonuclease [Methanobacteriaceae archaeon]